MFKFLRNTTLVIWLLISFASLAISTSIWAISQTIRVATLSTTLASTAVQNRRQIAKLKAKARLRRIATAVPLAGIGAAGYFEERDRRDWLEENPGKTNADYACEIAELSTEVMDEVLAELPMLVQLPDWAIPECELDVRQN